MFQHNLVFAIVCVSLAGCQQVKFDGRSLLSETHMSDRSVVLDLFFVRVPFADEKFNGELWQELDEQQTGSAVRSELTRAGFRVGVCGTHAPAIIEKLLTDKSNVQRPQENVITDLAADPIVLRRHLQLPAGKPTEILVSGVYGSLPLLDVDAVGHVSGRTYKKAQGVFTLHADPEPDGRVRIRLRPELQHGEARPQIKNVAGIPSATGSQHDMPVLLESRRARRTFDELTMEASLAAGEMLVVTSLPHRSGSVGHSFFTETASGGLNQKLLIVRLSQTQHDAIVDIPPVVDDTPPAAIADPVSDHQLPIEPAE